MDSIDPTWLLISCQWHHAFHDARIPLHSQPLVIPSSYNACAEENQWLDVNTYTPSMAISKGRNLRPRAEKVRHCPHPSKIKYSGKKWCLAVCNTLAFIRKGGGGVVVGGQASNQLSPRSGKALISPRLPRRLCNILRKQICNNPAIAPKPGWSQPPWSVQSVTSEPCLPPWKPPLFTSQAGLPIPSLPSSLH